MKQIILFTCILASFISLANAQDTVYLKRDARKKMVTDRPPQTLFVDLGGPGITYSGNYDTRFYNQTDGLGGRIGLGYNFGGNVHTTTIPIGINYLAGDYKRGRYFEAGFNETIVLANFTKDYDNYDTGIFTTDNSGHQTILMTSFTFGYRSQPVAGGFSFRTGVMPYLIQNKSNLSVYLSFGFNF